MAVVGVVTAHNIVWARDGRRRRKVTCFIYLGKNITFEKTVAWCDGQVGPLANRWAKLSRIVLWTTDHCCFLLWRIPNMYTPHPYCTEIRWVDPSAHVLDKILLQISKALPPVIGLDWPCPAEVCRIFLHKNVCPSNARLPRASAGIKRTEAYIAASAGTDSTGVSVWWLLWSAK